MEKEITKLSKQLMEAESAIKNLKDELLKAQTELLVFFKEVLPKIIIEHNFYETDEKKMSVDALANLIFERMDLSRKVIGEYSTAAFFTHQSKKE